MQQQKDPDKKWWHIDGMTDKEMHRFYGIMLFILCSPIAFATTPPSLGVVFAFLWVISAAVLKELRDYFTYGKFDPRDILATIYWPGVLSTPFFIHYLLFKYNYL